MNVSIKDIARAAQVSHSTVSRALADSPLISEPTRARIQELAQRMGYVPDAQARGLVMGRTMTIGVVVTTIADPFNAQVVQGIESQAHEQGYTVILVSSNLDPAREAAAVDMLRAKRVDAVIVTASRIGDLYQESLLRSGVPVLLINSHNEQGDARLLSIGVDNHQGGYLATQHLLDLGHRHIAYITGTPNHSDDRDRLAGCRQACAEAGLDPNAVHVLHGNGRADGGESVLRDLLWLSPVPTAVFCYNDMTAIGLLRGARDAGLAIPNDLAVVGFDDIPFAAYVSPALTTVAQPMFAMGQRAVQAALAQIEQSQQQAERILFEGELIVRESTGAHRAPAEEPERSIR
jgi:DNA-binding LacI/PurR family transcriptional regulator